MYFYTLNTYIFFTLQVNETECELSCHFVMNSFADKPGSCPRPDSAVGFEAVCLTSCSLDGDCSEHKKCCPNECGVTCREPDYSRYCKYIVFTRSFRTPQVIIIIV